MARFSLILSLLLCASAVAETAAKVLVEVQSTNVAHLTTARNWMVNRATNLHALTLNSISQVATNDSGVPHVVASISFAETNTAWRFWRFLRTNALPAGMSLTISYHLCAVDTDAEPGPCDVTTKHFQRVTR